MKMLGVARRLSVVLVLLTATSMAGSQEPPTEIVRPTLPDEIAAEVEQMESRIDEIRTAFLKSDVESLDEALELADEVRAIRVEHQSGWMDADGNPALWYEVADAQRVAPLLSVLNELSIEDRAAVLQADELDAQRAAAYDRGDHASAAEFATELLEIRRRVLGETHPDTFTTIRYLGGLLRLQDKLLEAERFYLEALPLMQRVLGHDHPDTLKTKANLGGMLLSQEKLAEAEPYLREALSGRRHVLGDDHPNTLNVIGNMGSLLNKQGRWSEAELFLREALEGKRRVLGDDDRGTLISINNLGGLLQAQGKLSESEAYRREALAGLQHLLGDDHRYTLLSMSNLGNLLQKQGKLSEAEPYFREALSSLRRVLGDDNPSTLAVMTNMGSVLSAQGRRPEAEQYYAEALSGMQQVLGEDHPETLNSIANMGSVLQWQGKLTEAEPYLREALEGSRRVLGDDHPSTLRAITHMGRLLSSQGKQSEAQRYHREALSGCRRVLGDDHPETLAAIGSLGNVLRSQGRLAEAEQHHRKALSGRRRVLGSDHPDTLRSINNVGVLLMAQGKLSDAEPYCQESLSVRRRVLGADHPHTLSSLGVMGALLKAQGKLSDAEPYYREALSGRRQVLGPGHPSTLNSVKAMGALRLAQGKPSEAEPYYREALSIARNLRGSATGGERGRAAMAAKVNLRGIVVNLSNLLAKRGAFDEAWTITEQGRGRALLDLLARSEENLELQLTDSSALEDAGSTEVNARVALAEAEARLAAMDKEFAVIDGDTAMDEDTRDARLTELDASLEAQHDVILGARGDLSEATAQVFLALQAVMPDAEPLSVEQIQEQLDPGDLVLGYSWDDGTVLLLTATNTSVSGAFVTKTEEDTAALSARMVALHESFAGKPGSAGSMPMSSAEASDVLMQLIPDEVADAVAAADRVIILPDGPLTGIPFEALATSVGSPVLDDNRQQIVYASSATVYLNRCEVAKERARADATMLVALGDPIFDREPESESESEPEYPTRGVLATRIVEGSNAASAGLSPGDVILAYGGEDVRDYDHVLEIKARRIAEVEAGERAADDLMTVRVWRDRKIIETTMTPGAMGIHLDRGNPAESLRSIAERSRGMEERIAEASQLDVVRLHGGVLAALPGTRVEVDHISELIGDDNTTTLTGEDATLANLEASVKGARYVHLATHGLVGSQDRPYDASLALTLPSPPGRDDIGFLTLDHLIRNWQNKLDACDLVTLSACDTQRGIRQGDALMSLPWGFYYAGAPTVIASLWQVDDKATALLMVRFYENLLGSHEDARTIRDVTYASGDTMPKADALQEAKRWLRTLEEEIEDRGVRRRGQRPKTWRPYEHPYYWAAFVLIGDPE